MKNLIPIKKCFEWSKRVRSSKLFLRSRKKKRLEIGFFTNNFVFFGVLQVM